MIKSISFIVLTQFFHFNQLKILRQPVTYFFKLNQQYFFYSVYTAIISHLAASYESMNFSATAQTD